MDFEKQVFISHSSKDADQTDRLVSALEARGIRCWVSHRDIPPGANYPQEILKGISQSDAMIVLVSSDSLRSPHVEREVERAVSSGKPIYPLRLIDIEIAGSLEYLLSVSHQIDLFNGPAENAYENLASAIKAGVAPEVKQESSKLQQFTGFAILVIFLALAMGFYLLFFNQDEQQKTEKTTSNDTVELSSDQSATNNLNVELWFSENTSSLARSKIANGLLYGFPVQNTPVHVVIFDEQPDGNIVKISDSSTLTKNAAAYQSFEQAVASEPSQITLCIKFKGLDKNNRFSDQFYLHRFYQSPTLGPAGSRVIAARKGDSCENVLGFAKFTDLTEITKDYELKKNIEQQASYSEIYSIEPIQFGKVGFKVTLYELGGSEKKVDPDRVSNVTLYVFSSEDGKNWKLFHRSEENFAFTTIHYEAIERPTPDFVRACVTSRIDAFNTYVVEDGSWRRNGQKGKYDFSTFVPKKMFLNSDGKFCTNINPDEDMVSKLELDPIEIAVPAESGGRFETAERDAAIASIRSGIAMPYGPRLDGFRLGMSMEDALSRAKEILPWSVRVDSFNSQLWVYNSEPNGNPIMFVDSQNNRAIILLPHKKYEVLAGVWLGYRPWQKRQISIQEYKSAFNKVFGPENRGEGDDYTSQASFFWSPSKRKLCRSSAYDLVSGIWDLTNSPLTSDEISSAIFTMQAPTPDPSIDGTFCHGFVMAKAWGIPDNPTFVSILFDFRAIEEINR